MNGFEKSGKYERAIWGSKVLLVAVGMVWSVILVKTTVIPYFNHVTFSILPELWLSFRSWVSPLYIYLVLNFIIFAIAATSTFPYSHSHNSKQSSSSSSSTEYYPNNKPTRTSHNQKYLINLDKNCSISNSNGRIISWRSFHFLQEKKPVAGDPSPEINFKENPTDERIEENQYYENNNNGKRDRVEMNIDEVVFVSKDNEVSVSGDESTNDDLDEYSTLEATWKAIMERKGKAEEEARQLQPRTTLARADHDNDDDQIKMEGEDHHGTEKNMMMMGRKWEKLSESLRLRIDKSIGDEEEEFNKRAEAFINKVNNDIRLQRLESDQRFIDMVNRGLHY
ncbi:hypothetical protein TIFTF001_028393 [Ficus carica]|uniref:DUF4408 domain-containing protein n=1 Tax=Ficus carica TaxID=3494 RepID=A0AA88DPY3_FICCA|nr:hypothetical protein TIFTF001_028393 [Ficus carica]